MSLAYPYFANGFNAVKGEHMKNDRFSAKLLLKNFDTLTMSEISRLCDWLRKEADYIDKHSEEISNNFKTTFEV